MATLKNSQRIQQGRLRINLYDDASYEKAILILDEEARLRGVDRREAAAQLVLEAIDEGDYPPEMQELIREIRDKEDW